MKLVCLLLAIAFMSGLAMPVCYAQDEGSRKVLKEGLMGAATGAIASSASGGKAGQGALIGAGVNVVGGALLDTITAPAAPAPQQVQTGQAAPAQTVQVQAVPSPYQQGYNDGYQKGFEVGYEKGYAAGIAAKK